MPRARSRRFSSAPAASACSSPSICLASAGSSSDREPARPELDGQRDQVLLGAVVDVALQPPPRLVLRGDQALPGRPQVLDQAARSTAPGPPATATSATSCSPAGRSGSSLRHPDRDRAQQLALMQHRDAQVRAGHRRHRLAIARAPGGRSRRCPAAERRPPARSSSSDPQPHHGPLGAGPRGHDLRHLRQDVLGRVGAADPLGEVGQHLVRRGPPAVHDPVGEPPRPLADRLERERHDRGRERRQQRAAPVPASVPTPTTSPT